MHLTWQRWLVTVQDPATSFGMAAHRPQSGKFWQCHVLQIMYGHALLAAVQRDDELTPLLCHICFVVDKVLAHGIYLPRQHSVSSRA